MPDLKQSLLELIKQRAILRGQFVLKSGKTSSYYIDMRLVTLSAAAAAVIGELMLEVVERERIDAVGGPSIGADPIVGSTLALAGQRGLPLAGFLVRSAVKEHGTQKLLEGPLKTGHRVLLVEDTVTTGGSLLKAAEEVGKVGAQVVLLLPLVDRLQGAREAASAANLRFHPLFTIRDLGLAD